MAEPDVAELESAFLTAWPAVRTAHDRSWIWREAGGYTKRANSAQAHDPADDTDASERLERAAALSRRHGIPPIFRVTPLAGPGVVAALDAAGWLAFDPSRVMSMPLSGQFTSTAPADILPATDPTYLADLARLEGYDAKTSALLAGILKLIAAPSAGILIRDDAGRAVAGALAVQTGRIGVFLNVVTDAERRGQGLGTQLMRAALAWVADAGATHAALQVTAHNAPALALYRRLGFQDRYGYHYRTPPG